MSGNISGTLIKNGIYNITSTLTIPTSESLTIEEGSILKFGSGIDFIINGLLDINGIKNNPVTITRIDTDDTDLRWGRIRFVDASANSEISYCNITYSSNGILFENTSNITFDNLYLNLYKQNNSSCIEGADNLTITNSTIENEMSAEGSSDIKYGLYNCNNITLDNSTVYVRTWASSQLSTNPTRKSYCLYQCTNTDISNSELTAYVVCYPAGGQSYAYAYGIDNSSNLNVNQSTIYASATSNTYSSDSYKHAYSYTISNSESLTSNNSHLKNYANANNGDIEYGYGVFNCDDCTIEDSKITIEDPHLYNGSSYGVYLDNSSNTRIFNNSLLGNWNYINGNEENSTAIKLTSSSSDIDLINNNIYAFSTGIETDAQNTNISYNNLFNCYTNYEGASLPAFVGVNAFENANGDSADFYNNISLDPIFLTTNSEDSLYLHIASISPNIDAGDPDLDKDGVNWALDTDDQDAMEQD